MDVEAMLKPFARAFSDLQIKLLCTKISKKDCICDNNIMQLITCSHDIPYFSAYIPPTEFFASAKRDETINIIHTMITFY